MFVDSNLINAMKNRVLRCINMVLSVLLAALGFNSCDDPKDEPCMYGPPTPSSYTPIETNSELESADVNTGTDEVDSDVKK